MKDFLHHLTERLLPYLSPAEARETAFWIIEESTGLSRTQILTGGKDTKNIPNIENILQRIAKKEPIQYIFQHTLWNGLDLKVTPDTLIPRPETAELVSLILNHKFEVIVPSGKEILNHKFEILNHKSKILNHKSKIRVLDIGTGSGCIAIALKKAHPEWQVFACDISESALDVARENARRNNVDITFFTADILNPKFDILNPKSEILNLKSEILNPKYDLVVSNPPYVRHSEAADMSASVLDYEPHTALFVPDNDPLLFYRRIAEFLITNRKSKITNRESLLFFEINESFGPAVCHLLDGLGYNDIQLYHDSYGKDRFVSARLIG
ncbi:MAG: peptide chain release factor N(5)-glutamine methyltransferase [Paludibacteraceae bacterium]|nr:peptide chain release factor N(5)-glutamine methyltransferase [Paludibacteraceae bacterium]